MRKSTFKLTKHELDFISDPTPMRLKQKIIKELSEQLGILGETIMSEYFKNESLWFKVTRGENYHAMPYLVLDTPQFKHNRLACKLRIMVWWGHYISLQYFISETLLTAEFLGNIAFRNYYILVNEDLFNNDLQSTSFVPIRLFINEKMTTPPITKICTLVDFNDIADLEKQVRLFLKDVHLI